MYTKYYCQYIRIRCPNRYYSWSTDSGQVSNHSGVSLFMIAAHVYFFFLMNFSTNGSEQIAALLVSNVDGLVPNDRR